MWIRVYNHVIGNKMARVKIQLVIQRLLTSLSFDFPKNICQTCMLCMCGRENLRGSPKMFLYWRVCLSLHVIIIKCHQIIGREMCMFAKCIQKISGAQCMLKSFHVSALNMVINNYTWRILPLNWIDSMLMRKLHLVKLEATTCVYSQSNNPQI